MNDTLKDAHELLSLVVHILATGDALRRERLLNAWQSQGYNLSPEHFTDELRPTFNVVRGFFDTRDGADGRIAASVAALTDHEVDLVVRKILDLHAEVTAAYYGAQ